MRRPWPTRGCCAMGEKIILQVDSVIKQNTDTRNLFSFSFQSVSILLLYLTAFHVSAFETWKQFIPPAIRIWESVCKMSMSCRVHCLLTDCSLAVLKTMHTHTSILAVTPYWILLKVHAPLENYGHFRILEKQNFLIQDLSFVESCILWSSGTFTYCI
jgi:hypothetical protein